MTPEAVPEVAVRHVADRENDAIRTRRAEKERLHAQRLMEVVERRRAGQTFDEIARRLKISREGTRKLYRSALKDFYREASEEERETALLRCDGVIRRWWPKMLDQDDATADLACKNLFRAMDFQAELWGLKRTKVDLTVNPMAMPADNEVWQALQRFRQAAMDGERAEQAALEVEATVATDPSSGNGNEP